jgi:hypothetical protein
MNAVPQSKYKYAFALLGNGRAFVESTVELARKGYAENWKFAILHLATALELLLKARLAIEDHRLLVDGKRHVSDRQFDDGDFNSVTVDECIKRLAQHSQFALTIRQRHTLSQLRILRNRVAHFTEPGDDAALKAAVAAGLNLFIELNEAAEFRDDETYGTKSVRELITALNEYEDFVKERMSALAERLQSASRPKTHHADECSFCLQDAAVIDGEKFRCLFCSYQTTLRDFAEARSDNDRADVCPDCSRHSVLISQWKDQKPTHECFIRIVSQSNSDFMSPKDPAASAISGCGNPTGNRPYFW